MGSSDESNDHKTFIKVNTDEMLNYFPDADNTCAVCQAEFLDTEDLVIHLEQVHKIACSVLKKCQLCDEAYSDMVNYAEHVRDNHLVSLKLCSICWRMFDDFDAHRIHCKKHRIDPYKSTYSCSQCPQRFAELFSLKKHELEHKNVREGFIMHNVLPYLSAALKVKAVTFIESLGTDVVYTCVGCTFTTVDLSKYIKHVQSKDCQVYVCHTCGNVFKTKKNLIKHFRSHCNMFGLRKKKTQMCPDCNISFPVQIYIKHKTHCKPIKCYTCHITFGTMNDWSDHQSREHSGHSIAVETCQFCWKRCVGSIAMKKHIDKTHRHEFHMYKYLCVYCKSAFKHPQKLFGHFLTKHKNITPYTCKICDEVFKYRKKFTIHIKLKHNSIGFVEFDENYHVFFSDKKSENPFVPTSIYINELKQNNSAIESNILRKDFIDMTDTDDYQTEPVHAEKPKRKRKSKTPKTCEQDITSRQVESSDEDETLNSVKRRVLFQKKGSILNLKKKRIQASNRKALTCKTCGKYCYTYQNYNHHTSLHSKHEAKKCIKCDEIFKSNTKLNEHIAMTHSSSKLTETLKTLLEKRKTGGSLIEDLPMPVRFRRTLVKAKTEISPTSAIITPVEEKLSVKKFFENFVPDQIKPELVDTAATIKLITGYAREPSIKMTKFKPNPISTSLKLAMPVKFVDHFPEKIKTTIKMVEASCNMDETVDFYPDHCDDSMDIDRQEPIPEVAEEVMLENTEETQKPAQNDLGHKIVIPKLPTKFTDIRIAHLLPEAPYYKIVKVKDVLSQTENKPNTSQTTPPASIKLADGTKLVTTNPLAHLLGDKRDEVLQSVKSKYYQPKIQNVQGILTKALKMLEKPTPTRKKKKVDSSLVQKDEEIQIKLEED